jgi:hypothetical protein
MKVAVIPADTAEPVRVEDPERINLDYLQKVTGGYVETIPVPYDTKGEQLAMYLNEEGKLEGLPYNPRATSLVRDVIQGSDFIAGNVVVCGPADDNGYDTGLTDEQLAGLGL